MVTTELVKALQSELYYARLFLSACVLLLFAVVYFFFIGLLLMFAQSSIHWQIALTCLGLAIVSILWFLFVLCLWRPESEKVLKRVLELGLAKPVTDMYGKDLTDALLRFSWSLLLVKEQFSVFAYVELT